MRYLGNGGVYKYVLIFTFSFVTIHGIVFYRQNASLLRESIYINRIRRQLQNVYISLVVFMGCRIAATQLKDRR